MNSDFDSMIDSIINEEDEADALIEKINDMYARMIESEARVSALEAELEIIKDRLSEMKGE